MITTIALIVAAVVILFLVAVLLQPSEFRVSRTGMVAAPQGVAFDQVNDLRKWENWSPWAKLDPNVKNTYQGPQAGIGAIFAWEGNSKVGAGRMTIIESQPASLLKIKLEFFKPMAAVNTVDFTFKPSGMQTEVTWLMVGANSFMGKAFDLFVNCEKMCGGFFEKGLASLDAVSREANAQQRATSQTAANV